MAFSMSGASLSVFELGLNTLSALLDKAEAFCRRKEDRSNRASAHAARARHVRLHPAGADGQRSGAPRRRTPRRRRTAERRGHRDDDRSAQTRLVKTIAYLKTLDPKRIDASADRDIKFPLGGGTSGLMKGADYLNHFVLPNYYFHLTAAYAILRHCGVEIGKRDFIGSIPLQRV